MSELGTPGRSMVGALAVLALTSCASVEDELWRVDLSPPWAPNDGAPDHAFAKCPQHDLQALSCALEVGEPSLLAPTPDDDFTDGFTILEGPVWLRGELYLSQINATEQAPPPSRLMRYDATTASLVVVDPDSGTNGLQLDPRGRLVAARHSDGTVSEISVRDPATTRDVLASEYAGARFNSPNDLAFHSNGTLYFTDPNWQAPTPNPQAAERAYLVPLGGAPEVIEAALVEPTLVLKPNGIALSQDQRRLYIGGTNGLFRFSLDAAGRVTSDDALHLDVAPDGVDGMTTDCAGNLYVTTGPRVIVLAPDERVLGALTLPRNPTNVEFGGPHRQTLFITTLETTVQDVQEKPALYGVRLGALVREFGKE